MENALPGRGLIDYCLTEIVNFPEISILLWIYDFYAQNDHKNKTFQLKQLFSIF